MANQYHDEQGRFTSKDGMQQAITDAKNRGDVNTALNLALEMGEIEASNAAVREQVLKEALAFSKLENVINWGTRSRVIQNYSTLIDKQVEPAAIAALYENTKPPANYTPDYHSDQNMVAYINNLNTPKEIRHLAMANLSTDKVRDLFERDYKPSAKETLKEIAEVRNSDRLRGKLMERLSKEEALELVHSAGTMAKYTEVHGWREEFNDEAITNLARDVNDPEWNPELDTYAIRYAPIDAVVDATIHGHNPRGSAFHSLIVSKRIETRDAAKLLTAALKGGDTENYGELRRRAIENTALSKEFRDALASDQIPTKAFRKGEPSKGDLEAVTTAKKDHAEARKGRNRWGHNWDHDNATREKYTKLQTEYDTHPGAFESLTKKYAKAQQDFQDGRIGEMAFGATKKRYDRAMDYLHQKSDADMLEHYSVQVIKG